METLECIFCHSVILIQDLKTTKNYVSHLDKHHKILFDMDHVLVRTLEQREIFKIQGDVLAQTEKEDIEPMETSDSMFEETVETGESLEAMFMRDSPVKENPVIQDNIKSSDKQNTETLDNVNSSIKQNLASKLIIKSEPVDDNVQVQIQNINLKSSDNQNLVNQDILKSAVKLKLMIQDNLKNATKENQVHRDTIKSTTKQNQVNEDMESSVKQNPISQDAIKSATKQIIKSEPVDDNFPVPITNIKIEQVTQVEESAKETDNNKRDYASAFSDDSGFQDTTPASKRNFPRLSNLVSSPEFSKNQFTAESTPKPLLGDKKLKLTPDDNVIKPSVVSLKIEEHSNAILTPSAVKEEQWQNTDSLMTKEEVEDNSKEASSPSGIPWYHGTIHSCQLCSRQCVDKASFKLHVETSHNIKFEEYQADHGDKSSQSNLHECEMCGKGVLWYRSAIEKHLTGQHNYSLERYYQEFKKYIELPVINITDESLVARFSGEQSDKGTKVPNGVYDGSWANRCIYQCKICDKESNSKYEFERHIQTIHSIMPGEYTKMQGRAVIHEEKHHCQIENCRSQIYWDRSYITGHLRKMHESMTLQNYEEKYMSNYEEKNESTISMFIPEIKLPEQKVENDLDWANKCIFKCSLCETQLKSRSRFGTHLKNEHGLSITEYSKEHGKSIIHVEKHSCQIESCDTFILWDLSTIYNHLYNIHDKLSVEEYGKLYMNNYVEKDSKTPAVSSNLSWANKCLFKCGICDKILGGRTLLKTHVSSAHDMSGEDYFKAHGRSLEKEVKHSCQVESCNATVSWDRTTIHDHLKRKHMMMPLSEYEEKYMANYVEGTGRLRTSSVNSEQSVKEQNYQASWTNRCIYKCNICGKLFKTPRYEFERHMPAVHSIAISDYTKEHGKTMEHEEKHSCQVENCYSKVNWEHKSISTHLRIHEISLQDYEAKYMDNYAEKEGASTANISSTSNNLSYQASWANRCIYKCNICGMTFKNTRYEFERHMPAVHSMTIGDYAKEHGKTMEHEEKHCCQVENCKSVITWEKGYIYKHLYSVHDGMSLQDYEEKYMDNYAEKEGTCTANTSSTSNNSNYQASWANRCIYKCNICGMTFKNTRYEFEKHFPAVHSMTIGDYAKEHGKTMEHEEKHCCQVENCKSVITWEKNYIYKHLYSVHDGMSLQDYEEKYMGNYAEKEGASTANTSSTSNNSNYQASWANRCIYKCNICGMTFKNTRYEFERHMPAVHSMAIGYYTKEHGKTMEHEEKHSCQVENCNSKINWEHKSISSHLRMHHEMSLQDYESKYMENYEEKEGASNANVSSTSNNSNYQASWANRCIYKCNICGMTFKNSKYEYEKHFPYVHSMTIGGYVKQHGKTMEHEEKHCCQVEDCKSVITWEKYCIYKHLASQHDGMSLQEYEEKYMSNYTERENVGTSSAREHGQTFLWASRCIYKCSICETEVKSRGLFEYHMKTKHNMPMKEYTTQYGRTLSHEEKHSCQVKDCNSYILWDKAAIKDHIKSVHDKMTLEEYEKNWMNDYKEKPMAEKLHLLKTKSFSSPFGHWANRCVFKCVLCELTTKSKPEFKSHIKSKHNISKLDYATKYGRTMDHEEKHHCQVEECGGVFWWSLDSFNSHFKLKHEGLSLSDYEAKYMEDYKEISPSVSKPGPNHSQDTYSECQFSCNICKPGKIFNSRAKAANHMKTVHKTNLKAYKEKYGSSITFKVNHVCHICAGIVLLDKSSIQTHLYNVHNGFPIENYFDKYVTNFQDESDWLNEVIFTCKECDKETGFTTKKRKELWEHVKEIHEKTELEYRSIHGSMYGPDLPVAHTCQVCFYKVNWENISLKPHIELKHEMSLQQYEEKHKESYADKHARVQNAAAPIHHVETEEEVDAEALKWTAGSLYKCNLCQKAVPGLHQFKKHLNDRHEHDYRQYEKTYDPKEFTLFAGFHICLICQKNVRHDFQYLKNHIKEHALTLSQYYNQYNPKAPKLMKIMKLKDKE